MPVSAEVLTIIIAVLTTVFGGAWALFKFVKSLERKASLKEKEVTDNKFTDRLASNEKALKEAKVTNAKSIENLEEKLKLEQDKLMIRVDYLEKEVDNISTKQSQDHTKHDEIISDIREVLADIRETIAGFGKDFVTRREFLDSKRRDRDV